MIWREYLTRLRNCNVSGNEGLGRGQYRVHGSTIYSLQSLSSRTRPGTQVGYEKLSSCHPALDRFV